MWPRFPLAVFGWELWAAGDAAAPAFLWRALPYDCVNHFAIPAPGPRPHPYHILPNRDVLGIQCGVLLPYVLATVAPVCREVLLLKFHWFECRGGPDASALAGVRLRVCVWVSVSV